MIYRSLLFCAAIILFAACRPSPFRVQHVSVKPDAEVAPTDQEIAARFEMNVDAALAERYKKKKRPSFALINGYYRLPETHPYGAATLVRAYSYQTYFEAVKVEKPTRDAITPIAGDDANSLAKALDALLSAGVVIKEIAMSDALAIARAEKDAIDAKKTFVSGTTLAPDVDYLMSIYPSSSKRGPVLIGRVIKRDGTLMAFRVIHRGSSTDLVGGLIVSLFEDTLRRI